MTTDRETLRIGTRGSPLALWQAERVRDLLRATDPALEVEIVPLRSSGEEFPERSFSEIGVGVFTREIDAAVLDGRVALGVHSLKDVPTEIPPGLVLAAVPERASPLDAWVSGDGLPLAGLPPGAQVGTSSPRRQAQLLDRRPDVGVVSLRGNVQTRLRKIRELGLAGTILAEAGLRRLGYEDRITESIPADWIVPAVGQGALAVVAREDAGALVERLGRLEDATARVRVDAERAFLRTLRGGCQVPAGALATVDAATGDLHVHGVLCSLDGRTVLRSRAAGPAEGGAGAIGQRLAEELLGRGGEAILRDIRGGSGAEGDGT